MFLELADTPPTRDGIRAFADVYGTLGETRDVLGGREDPPEAGEDGGDTPAARLVATYELWAEAQYGDEFETWATAIAGLAAAVALFRR
ncbi:MAG: hypothetical protein ACRC7O_00730 [Fimbriiglobus sp.]